MFKMFKIHSKGAFLVGALLLALAISGGAFAAGFLSNTVQLTGVGAANDYSTVVPASPLPSWTVYGALKGTIGTGSLFTVSTLTSGYTGKLMATVSIANGSDLVKVYRQLSLLLYVVSSNNTQLDINSSNSTGLAEADDVVLLTLDNGSVNFYLDQTFGSDNYTVMVQKGFYIANIKGQGWPANAQQPVLYCDVAQR